MICVYCIFIVEKNYKKEQWGTSKLKQKQKYLTMICQTKNNAMEKQKNKTITKEWREQFEAYVYV